jgi:hypothetical protein
MKFVIVEDGLKWPSLDQLRIDNWNKTPITRVMMAMSSLPLRLVWNR